MNESAQHQRLIRETAYLSIFSVALQGLGLLLNIFLTRALGAASVGALTLISSFYSLAAVLSGGSGFIATSRFVSEELGCAGNPNRVFHYALRFCMLLSSSVCGLLCIFAPWLTGFLSETGATALTIRLMSICLPLAACSACLKGRCYAYHRVYLPAIAECVEFLIRAGVMAFCAVFCIPIGRLSLLTSFALSMLAGQGATTLFLAFIRIPKDAHVGQCQLRFGTFLRLIFPIMGNACLVSLLSSANDALVPLTLLQFGNSTEEALSQFGEFEAIIIPTLFFPSVIQCCMSGLLVPELSHARSANNHDGIRRLTQRVLEQTASFSLYIVLLLWLFGDIIGTFLGGDAFAGHILKCMAPVVPFIYLEIIMEGILRGLGKQNFSSLNYLAEYMVRISVLLICVPLFGFYGIVASYMACNLSGNIVRLFFVLRLTGLKPNWKRILLQPIFAVTFSWQLSRLLLWVLQGNRWSQTVYFVSFSVLCGILILFMLRVLEQLSSSHTRTESNPSPMLKGEAAS